MLALSVEANIIRHCAQKTLLSQPRVPYVERNTQRVTKDVSYTKTYSKLEVKPVAQYTQLSLSLLLPQLTSLTPANFPPTSQTTSRSGTRAPTHSILSFFYTPSMAGHQDRTAVYFSYRIQIDVQPTDTTKRHDLKHAQYCHTKTHSLMPAPLPVVFWNANGLSNHKLELQDYLDMHKIYIALNPKHTLHHDQFLKFHIIPYIILYTLTTLHTEEQQSYCTLWRRCTRRSSNHTVHSDDTAHGGAAIILYTLTTLHTEEQQSYSVVLYVITSYYITSPKQYRLQPSGLIFAHCPWRYLPSTAPRVTSYLPTIISRSSDPWDPDSW